MEHPLRMTATLRKALVGAGTPTDTELLRRYLEGDVGAFEFLIWRHGAVIWGACRTIVHDRHAAEDAFQAVCLVLARNARTIKNPETIAVWLHQVAIRIARRAARRRVESPLVTDPVARERAQDLDTERLVHEEVDRLPNRYRAPIVLCYFEGLTHLEAARRLGWPHGSVNGRIERAKKLLADRLARRGVALPLSIAATIPLTGAIHASCNAAVAFVLGNVAGISPNVLKLAKGVEMFTFAHKLVFGISVSLVCGMLYASGIGKPEIPSDFPVLAPVQKKVGIDGKTIAEYEKAGAVYGGFIASPDRVMPEFIPGAQAAIEGIPGFCWYRVPNSEIPTIPTPPVEFGIEIKDERSLSRYDRLSSLKGLRVLILHSRELGEERFEAQVDISKLGLRHLALHWIYLSDKFLNQLTQTRGLESLTIGNTLMMPENLADVPSLEAIESLPAEIKQLAGIKSKTITALKQLTSLKHLAVHQSLFWLEPSDYESLSSLRLQSFQIISGVTPSVELENWNELETLILGSAEEPMTASALAFLVKGKLTHLKHFELWGPYVREKNSPSFGEIVKQYPNLETLVLTGAFSFEDTQSISKLKELRRLHLGSLLWQRMDSSWVKNLMNLKNLESLTLWGTIREAEIVEMKKLTKLKSLELTRTLPSEASIAALSTLPCLENLTIENCKGEQGEALCLKLSSLSNLKSLTFTTEEQQNDCNISAEMLKNLSKLKQLKNFGFRGRMEPDAYAAIANFSALEELMIRNYDVDTDSLAESLSHLKHLRKLTMNYSLETSKKFDVIRQSLRSNVGIWRAEDAEMQIIRPERDS